ncbi:hypothetical protein HDR61_00435 [bacterium]|nr:hypothetical protein [bacterium]
MKYKQFKDLEKYTWLHKLAFLKVERELLGHNTMRGYMHDLDKLLFLYPWAFITGRDKKWAHNKHRANQRHHVENKQQKTRRDYIEMIIDWECARFTKPDKPLNAYETMRKFYPQLEPQILPILRELGLVH